MHVFPSNNTFSINQNSFFVTDYLKSKMRRVNLFWKCATKPNMTKHKASFRQFSHVSSSISHTSVRRNPSRSLKSKLKIFHNQSHLDERYSDCAISSFNNLLNMNDPLSHPITATELDEISTQTSIDFGFWSVAHVCVWCRYQEAKICNQEHLAMW